MTSPHSGNGRVSGKDSTGLPSHRGLLAKVEINGKGRDIVLRKLI